ncbi:MAG: type II secretion system protein GspH [Gammaproteobacteria bacterium]|jgi:general secretion pathway protein H|nr:type II secretion system protein GspH [Gammaproteobacteria bacterium]
MAPAISRRTTDLQRQLIDSQHRTYLSQGFTLIEILVVLFIVSIMTGIAVVNMPAFLQTGDFDSETDRLKVVVEMLRDEAMVQASEYGFRPDRNSYQFYIYNDLQQSWELLAEKPFKGRRLPTEFEIEVKIEGHELQFGEEEAPPILILSSGEITPFELQIESRLDADQLRTLESDGYGSLVWQGEEDEE